MGTRATILVVEDNAITSKLVRVVLEEEGYEVLMSATGAAALEHAARRVPDLILQDLVLPDMTGFELVEKLRQLPGCADTIILAFTGFVSDTEDERIASAPFDGLLIKPVAPTRLVATIEDFLKRAPRPVPRSAPPPRNQPSAGLDHAQRAELQASALGVLGTIADALSAQGDVETALGEVLAQAVDAAGLSRGAVLLFQPGGALTCLSQVGFDTSVDELTTVVGPELLSEVRATGSVLILTPDTASSDMGRALLVRTGASSALVAPIASGPAEIGILLLTSATQLLTGDEWRGFARALAAQLGQAIALRRAFESISESERRYRTLFETVNLIALSLDSRGRVDYVNPFFLRLAGYEAAEVIGRDWFTFLPVSDRVNMKKVFVELMLHDRGHHAHYQNPILAKSGDERMIAWHNTVLRGADGHPVGTLSIGEDITERLRTERQLVQAQKMEAVGQLAGGIAHDFNNLLAAITVFAELVELDLPAGDAHREDLDQIQQAVLRAQRLTRQLLAFSKQQVLQPAVIDPNVVIGDLVKLLGRLIGEDIELILDLSPSVGTIRVDPGQLEQVLMNLSVNARDAMPSGGRLTFSTRREGKDVILSVADTGTGMSDEVRLRIFEPFFTTKEGKGTGLGLATVHGIVQQSGGRIEVSSKLSRGTTFTIALPATEGEPVAAGAAGTRETPRGTETILLVEDDPAVRHAASSVLRRLGYTVLEARSGAEGLVIAEEHTDPIHLALSDVVMPGMDGRDFLEHLRATRPAIKGALMSGYAGDMIARHGPLSAETPLIVKPFTSRSLGEKVREILGSAG